MINTDSIMVVNKCCTKCGTIVTIFNTGTRNGRLKSQCRRCYNKWNTEYRINENGRDHRRILGVQTGKKMTGMTFYKWLKEQGFPKDNYQVLCHNCNFAKYMLGKCLHQDDCYRK